MLTAPRAKAQALADQLGCQATDNQTVAARCELIFLGVKPQMMAGLLESIGADVGGAEGPVRPGLDGGGLTARRIQELAGGITPSSA